MLNESGVAISMDGGGRCMDNIFIERLWRSLKYEALYLHELSTASGPEGDFPVGGVLQFTAPSLCLGGSHPCRGL